MKKYLIVILVSLIGTSTYACPTKPTVDGYRTVANGATKVDYTLSSGSKDILCRAYNYSGNIIGSGQRLSQPAGPGYLYIKAQGSVSKIKCWTN